MSDLVKAVDYVEDALAGRTGEDAAVFMSGVVLETASACYDIVEEIGFIAESYAQDISQETDLCMNGEFEQHFLNNKPEDSAYLVDSALLIAPEILTLALKLGNLAQKINQQVQAVHMIADAVDA